VQLSPYSASQRVDFVLEGGDVATNWTLSATCANTSLIPNANIALGGSARNRFLEITTTGVGDTTLTVAVTDSTGLLSHHVTVPVTVQDVSVNENPTLNTIGDTTIAEDEGLQAIGLSGITSGSVSESQALTVTATSSNPSVIPHPTVNYTNPNSTGTVSFTPVPNAYGSAVVTVTVNDNQAVNNLFSRTFTVTVLPVNDAPTLSPLLPLSLSEDPGQQTVNLTGISSGHANESQTLSVTASSSNPSIVPNPTVSYTSPNTTGTLAFTPMANANGSSVITVTVNDGQSVNASITRTFTVTVGAINDPPTLNTLVDRSYSEDAGPQVVALTGIGSGSVNESQTLTITARSSNTALIPDPVVSYVSPANAGSLTLVPAAHASGTAQITVTVNDGQATNQLTTQSFTVTVASVNDQPSLAILTDVVLAENAGVQTVALGGISPGPGEGSQTVTIIAQSSNPALIPHPHVTYSGSGATGSLEFEPVANASGSATITVTVDDGQASNNILTRTFQVSVAAINHAPVVIIGTNTSTQPNVTFMVRCRITDDGLPANPGRVTARWTKISGPGPVTIGNSNAALTTMRFTAQGMYRMRLTGFDGELSSSGDFIVFVRSNTDFAPPAFDVVTVSELTDSSLSVQWATDEVATQQVEYTVDGGVPMVTLLDQALRLDHTVTLTNLLPNTTYTLRARSRDSSGNLGYSSPIVVTTLERARIYIPLWPKHISLVAPVVSVPDRYDRDSLWFPQPEQGSAAMSFIAPVRANYDIWARVYFPSAASDQLDLTLDGVALSSFDLTRDSTNTWSDDWQWVKIGTSRLASGTHEVKVVAREGGLGVSQFLITSLSDVYPYDGMTLHGSRTVLTQDQPSYGMSVATGWSMISSPLNTMDPSIASLLPNPPAGSEFFKYDVATGGYVTNRFLESGWVIPEMVLTAGEGGMFHNPGAPFLWSVVGDVQEAVVPTIQPGVNWLTMVPGRGGLLSRLLPGVTFEAGDSVHRLDPATGQFVTYSFDGFSWDLEPQINLGEAIFFRRSL
jgi:hypothetical protein